VGLAVLVLGGWLSGTPPGLLGKADAVGYALCHRIDARSFHLGDRQLPLCVRCTGTYLGALIGLAGMAAMGRTRAGGLPRLSIALALAGFIGLMGIDGLNSYSALFPGVQPVYEPQHWLRLVTGTLNGLALAALIYPAFNQTLWARWDERAVIGRWRELGALVLAGAGMVALVLTESAWVLYPAALLSALGVVLMLVVLNTTLLLIVSRRGNRATSWRDAVLPVVAGLTLALLEIGLVDAVRYAVFGTWGGLPVPG
jgi:uncharacterized membrane protein